MVDKEPPEVVVQEEELLEEAEVVGDHLCRDQGLGPQPPEERHNDTMNDQSGSSPQCSQEAQR